MSREILINQLFAGKYLQEGENIGHEVINLFRDDEGNHNIFVTPSGRINGHDIEYILFVRHISARRTAEVIGLAKDIRNITDKEIKSIKYAGASLDQIFKNNTYHGGKDTVTTHVTYRAGRFLIPSRRIIISLDATPGFEEYTVILDSKKLVITPQGMREYYTTKNDPMAYSQLRALVENEELWDEKSTAERLYPDGSAQNQSASFLEIIRKEDDENILSNLLGYYFGYSHRSFQRFAAEPKLLDIRDMSASFDVYRETMNRVDLWIESEKDIIVIENKIKSGINGITRDDYSQLNRYHEVAEKEALNSNKRTHYYIFAPDYAKFDLSQFGLKDVYKIVRYSDIYRFFVNEMETYIADRAFSDFIRGLRRHTLTYPELQFGTMRSRLLRKINMLQN